MRKILFFAAVAAVCLSACTKQAEEMTDSQSPMAGDSITVSLHFTRFEIEREAISRAATDVDEYVTRLDIWLSDGRTQNEYHQATGTGGFGSLTVTLDKKTTYTLYAVAHRCSGPATLQDGIVSFPDEKTTHSFFYSQTFQPTESTSSVCPMNRIVGMLRFEVTDPVPDACRKFRFTVSDVFRSWNVEGFGASPSDLTSVINIVNYNQDGSASFNVYAIVTDEETGHDVLIEALTEDDDVLQSRQMTDVPLRNGYKTIARGEFFSNAVSAGFRFVADDWQAGQTIDL